MWASPVISGVSKDNGANVVHQKDNISRILWYSDWLHNTTSAGNSIFVTNHDTTSCGRSMMQPESDYRRIWQMISPRLTFWWIPHCWGWINALNPRAWQWIPELENESPFWWRILFLPVYRSLQKDLKQIHMVIIFKFFKKFKISLKTNDFLPYNASPIEILKSF